MSLKPKVALSQDFLLNLSKLPTGVHSKVMKWAIRFQADPQSPSINYENIHAAADANMRSVRIDDDWRGIVFKPDRGDVYVLLHVNKHDEAYRWAERRKLIINPVTGAMQMVMVEETAPLSAASSAALAVPLAVSKAKSKKLPASSAIAVPAASVQAKTDKPYADGVSDHDLMALGVPPDLLERVKGVSSESELDGLQAVLPVEGYEALFLLAAGDLASQILNSRETRVDRQIDTSNFEAALQTPESQSRFVVVDDEAMVAIMNAPLSQWRVFLHPTQHKLASGDRSGPVRVLGGAGTGKTVVAMHRAKWLAENRTPDKQKVLFTTFTKNLALDIEDNLKTLCAKATMQKIEVRNLDSWVYGFMRSRKLEHRIVYGRKADGALLAWQAALTVKNTSLDLPDSFYEEELEQVVLSQGVTSRDDYRTVRRTGRGVVLSRAKRDAIWPVFEEYRGQLALRKLKEVDDAYRDVASLMDEEIMAGKLPANYSAIVIDETQDFGPQALRLLRAMMASNPNDLFFVGDGHQRIYTRNRAAMSKCGIDIRGRSKKLYLNYRTTDEIRIQALAVLEGCEIDDLDDGQDESQRYKSLSHGPAPLVIQVPTHEEAFAKTMSLVREWTEHDSPVSAMTTCVIAASKKSRDALAKHFQLNGLKVAVIDENQNAGTILGATYFATMHRAKGLEFDRVIVLAPNNYLGDPLETDSKRKLIYVALTRAKQLAALLVV
jgi:superfamily I DNA/RNA helicase